MTAARHTTETPPPPRKHRTVTIRRSLFVSMALFITLVCGAVFLVMVGRNVHVVRRYSRQLINRTCNEVETELHRLFGPIPKQLSVARRWDAAGLMRHCNAADAVDLNGPEEGRELLERVPPDALRQAQTLNSLVGPLLREFEQISSALVADQDGNEYLVLQREDGWMNRLAFPEQWGRDVLKLYWDPALEHCHRTEWDTSGYDTTERPWWRGAMARYRELGPPGDDVRPHVHWTGTYPFHTTGELGITGSLAFEGSNGDVTVVALDVKLKDISNFTKALHPAGGGVVVVCDSEGRVIGLPGREQFTRLHDPDASLFADINELNIPEVAEVIGWRTQWDRGAQTVQFFKTARGRWGGGLRAYHLGRGKKLWIGVLLPEEAVGLSIEWRLATFALVLAVVLALGMLSAAFLSRRYSRPLAALVEQSRRIGNLDLAPHPPMHSMYKEVDQLSHAMDDMRAALATEVTGRQRATEALRRSEERYRALIENSSDAIATLDADLRFTYVSTSATRLLGYRPEELMARRALENVHPDDRPGLERILDNMLRKPNVVLPAQFRYRHKAGEWRHVETAAVNMLGNPDVGGIVVNIRDVTDRIEAQQALRDSEARARGILETASDAIITIDETGCIESVNPAAERMFGFTAGEMRGMQVRLLMPAGDAEQHETQFQEYLRTGGGQFAGKGAMEWRGRRKDGAEFPIRVSVNEVRLADQRFFTGVITDITEKKKAEKLLRDYSRTLEAEVRERTRELREAQNKLMLQEKMASLGSLTAGIAHEIKNPLNFVNNFAGVATELVQELGGAMAAALEGMDPDERAEAETLLNDIHTNVAKIAEHGKRADGIVQGMLAHSRGKAGSFQATALNALVDEYTDLAYHGIRARDATFNVAIDKDFDPNLGEIEVVPQNLSRVILNLVNNACYATAKRRREAGEAGYQPRITVSTRDLGSQAEIRVRDNGPGIPAGVREKLFEPFFTTKPAGEGTGLGLSICYNIVTEEHGGEIRVQSQEGEFAEFVVTVPKQRG